MGITAGQLNRATLTRQLLVRREEIGVSEAVRRVVALQAQQVASPYLALWNRVAGFDPAQLDAAFADRTIVKSTLMRITLHAVHTEDFPVFLQAVHPSIRAARLGDDRFTASGLTAVEGDALVADVLDFGDRPRTSAEFEAWLADRLGAQAGAPAWWGLRQVAPLLRAPGGETWSFGQKLSYIAPAVRPVLRDPEVAAASLRALVLRYLDGFGPASVADVAQFALVQRGRAREALKVLAAEGGVERLTGPDGGELFDLPDAPRPDGDTPVPARLMAMWDSVLLAYADRSRVIPPDYRALVIKRNGDVLPTLLVDGYVAGVWRTAEGGIEATAFHSLPDEAWDQLATEARSLTALLADREPDVYRRYHHWWSKPAKLPAGTETRLLPGA
ncbi:winged helix DNA-binding domain-containing protein [Kitasatospora misakiensis]|uniref:Winged helix DNA-binding domain-containing protein n=1 Tax=Kitasatospora misakiensis TaxID=67330 RepID=A0ABW0X7Q7_9ACTN